MTRPQCTCKFGVSPACPAHGKKKDDPTDGLDQYRVWFNKNHPFDWWAEERNGKPLPPKRSTPITTSWLASLSVSRALRKSPPSSSAVWRVGVRLK